MDTSLTTTLDIGSPELLFFEAFDRCSLIADKVSCIHYLAVFDQQGSEGISANIQPQSGRERQLMHAKSALGLCLDLHSIRLE